MRTLLCLAALVSTVACHGRRLYDEPAPLRDDGQPCRRYAEGIEYCGERKGGLPSGRGTMRMPDGQKLTGIWKGPVVHDGVLEVDDRRIVYADFDGLEPIGSHQIYDPSTSETTQVFVTGDARKEIVYAASGAPHRIATSQGDGDEKQVVLIDASGTETYYREKNGAREGDVVSIASNGAVTLEIFEHGVNVTAQALPARVLQEAGNLAVSGATAEAETAARARESADQAATAAEATDQRAVDAAAERRADDSLKTPCTCIAEKRRGGQDPMGCHSNPSYVPPGCQCALIGCIVLQRDSDTCDEECQRALEEQKRVERQQCVAERDAYWAAQRDKFRRRTDVCTRFPADPAAVDREWGRLTAEHNAEVDRELANVRQRTRAAVESSRRALQAAIERDRAARARLKAAEQAREQAREADLRREAEIAQQRILGEARRQAEEARARKRDNCAKHPRLCECRPPGPPIRPKPGSHGVCPA